MAKHDDILQQAAKRFKLVAEQERDEREHADDDIRFASNDDGCQWPAELRKVREGDSRPCLVLNKIPEKVDQVDGEFKQLRPSIKVRAIDNQADPKIAEIIAGLIRHIEYDSNAKVAYQTAHTSTLLCGRGAWRINLIDSIDDPFVRDIKITRIPNVLTVYWDSYAKQPDLSDADYIFVTEIISKEEFIQQYKDVSDSWPVDDVWNHWKTDDGVRIAEYWWKDQVDRTFYQVLRYPGGVETVVTVSQPMPEDQIIQEKKVKWPQVRWAKLAAGTVLEGPHDWPGKYIPVVVELGKEVNIRGQQKTRGMVRHAKDAQRMYNFWSSATTEQVALQPKSPYLATAKMIGPYQAMWDRAHEKNWPYLLYDVDEMAPGAGPRREPPPQMSSAYQHEFMRLEHDIMSAMGIYAASLGDEGKEVSGRAIQARQRQGSIGSYPYTDSFHTALTYSGKILVDLIPHVYDTERVVRILGPDGEEDTVPINARPGVQLPQVPQVPEKLTAGPRDGITQYLNDITVGKYDVAVTIGPSYTVQREETLAILLDIVKTAPGIAQNILDLIVQNMDMPHSEELIKRLKRMVPLGIRDPEPDEQAPEPQPDPRVMLEMAKLELQKVDLQRKEFEAQVKAIKDLAEAESKEVGAQLQIMTSLMGEIRAKIDQDHGMKARERELGMQEQQLTSEQNTGQNSP